jgi:hypothetical protein
VCSIAVIDMWFCIFATDRAPKPNEWKYLTQGMINRRRALRVLNIDE